MSGVELLAPLARVFVAEVFVFLLGWASHAAWHRRDHILEWVEEKAVDRRRAARPLGVVLGGEGRFREPPSAVRALRPPYDQDTEGGERA